MLYSIFIFLTYIRMFVEGYNQMAVQIQSMGKEWFEDQHHAQTGQGTLQGMPHSGLLKIIHAQVKQKPQEGQQQTGLQSSWSSVPLFPAGSTQV